MFHALPPSAEDEVGRTLAGLAKNRAPAATLIGLMGLGRGVAYRVSSDGLQAVRSTVADRFHGSLTAQDSASWRPHVTVQNKVDPSVAKETLSALEGSFRPRRLAIVGLGLHRYAGGPWDFLGRWMFR